MSKKRFIKLMMARGYSRNTAVALTTQVSQFGTYAAMYQRLAIELVPTLAQISQDLIRRVFEVFAIICNAVAVAFTGYAESFRRLADEYARDEFPPISKMALKGYPLC